MKFTIQEHRAKRAGLHYDWRFEKDGKAVSFVVKRTVEKDFDKFLMIPVEDHPVDYMEWEGRIEDGYGAGTVKLYTKGTWTPIQYDEDWNGNLKKWKMIIKSPVLSGRLEIIPFKGKYLGIFKGEK